MSPDAQNYMPSYEEESCGLCGGLGYGGLGTQEPCPPCQGSGKVLVLQPPIRCPRCGGDGKAKDQSYSAFFSKLCVVCRGAGWVMTKDV